MTHSAKAGALVAKNASMHAAMIRMAEVLVAVTPKTIIPRKIIRWEQLVVKIEIGEPWPLPPTRQWHSPRLD